MENRKQVAGLDMRGGTREMPTWQPAVDEEEGLGAGRAHGRMRDEGRGASRTRVRRYTVNYGIIIMAKQTAATKNAATENSTNKPIKNRSRVESKHDLLMISYAFLIVLRYTNKKINAYIHNYKTSHALKSITRSKMPSVLKKKRKKERKM